MLSSTVDNDASDSLRRYTQQLALRQSRDAPITTLERFLIQDEEIETQIRHHEDEWRKYYEPWHPSDVNSDPVTEVLRIEAKNLSRIWLRFRRDLPVEQRDDTEGQIPSVEGLVQMVTRYTSNREEEKAKTKRGKFMRHFSSVCSTIESHQVMLDVLPCGNEYVSVFTGALKTIVTACSNYDRISQGLAEALSRIGKNITACVKEASLFRTADMLTRLAKLYAEIFLFLQDVMDWYMKKSRSRFLDAFRGNFYDEFKGKIDVILEMSHNVKREADVGSKAEVRSVRLRTDDIYDNLVRVSDELYDLRLGMEGSARDLAEVRQIVKYTAQANERHRQSQIQAKEELPDKVEYMTEIISQIIATANAKNLLNSRGRVFHEQHRPQKFSSNMMQSLDCPEDLFESSKTDVHIFRKDDIEFASKHLEDYFDRSKLVLEHNKNEYISLDATIGSNVQEWAVAPESSILSLAGYVVDWPEVSQATLLSAMCVHSATKAELRVVSYFCELRRGQKIRDGNTRQSQELLALLSTLIRQLVVFLPPEFETNHDLSPQRFEELDGTMRTWSTGLNLLRYLLTFTQPRLYCIIDGFQWLDDNSTKAALKELVSALRGEHLSNGHSLKVLITTQGRSACLERELARDELLYADQERAGSGSRRKLGGMPFTTSIA